MEMKTRGKASYQHDACLNMVSRSTVGSFSAPMSPRLEELTHSNPAGHERDLMSRAQEVKCHITPKMNPTMKDLGGTTCKGAGLADYCTYLP